METLTTINHAPTARLRTARRYKEIATTYEAIIKILAAIAAVLLAAVISLAMRLSSAKNYNDSLADQVHNLTIENEQLNNTITDMTSDSDALTARNSALTLQNNVLKDSVSGMKDTIETLDSSNAKLIKDNKSLSSDLKKFTKRSELYDKYEYAIYNKSGDRTDLKYDQIATGEELMKKAGIDPDLLFGIIMTESGGNEKASNSTSTARGFGQMLAGTGEYVYEDILNLGTYNHSMAYNGDTNIRMVVGYLGYLKNTRHMSAYNAVKAYRGVEPTGYIKTINSYINKKGNSFAEIAANW